MTLRKCDFKLGYRFCYENVFSYFFKDTLLSIKLKDLVG